MTNQILDTFNYSAHAAIHFHAGLSHDLARIISPHEMYYIAEGQAVRRYESTIQFLKTYDSVCVLMRNESSLKVFEETSESGSASAVATRGHAVAGKYSPSGQCLSDDNSKCTERVLFFYDSRNILNGAAMLWLPGNINRPVTPIRFGRIDVPGVGDQSYYEAHAESFHAHPVAWMKHMICEMLTINRVHRAHAIHGSDHGHHFLSALEPGWQDITDEFRLMPYELCVGSRALMLDVWDGFVKANMYPLEMKMSGTALCPGRESVAISGVSPTMSFGWWLESCGDYLIGGYYNDIIAAFSDHLVINNQEKFSLVSGLPSCDDHPWHIPNTDWSDRADRRANRNLELLVKLMNLSPGKLPDDAGPGRCPRPLTARRRSSRRKLDVAGNG